MRGLRWSILGAVVLSLAACGGGSKNHDKPDAGIDAVQAQCNDGVDNDGDGKIDYPYDPGCFSPNQDDETDDCPTGPTCPQCANAQDDDMNGISDYPDDPGCSAASDTDEYTDNPLACGAPVRIKSLPIDGHATGMLMGSTSNLQGACGGAGAEDVYELRIQHPKVVVATTNGSSTDTVVYIRNSMCTDATMELACNDDTSPGNLASTVNASIVQPGTYYLVVDSKTATGGSYDLRVQFLVGEGDPCTTGDDCGPGLVCRVPLNGTTKVCAKHVCSDGVDDDADGKNDYPQDPGCTAADDDDEMDDCPSGPNCPECGNGSDDDHDGTTDFPADTNCQSASSTSESCPTHEGVLPITMATTNGDTSTATSDADPTCAFDTGLPDLTYRLDLPALDSLTVSVSATWYPVLELLGATCAGTALACDEFDNTFTTTNQAAGTYYLVVDGDFTGDSGPFTLTVAGKIKNHQSCESPLAQAGALTCGTGYTCTGTMGSRTCEPALCSDGVDNDSDGKTDYPFDPGCTDPADNDETNPATLPVCSNTTDDDTDGQTDFPADYGCSSAGGTSEVFCTGEMDATALISAKTTTGTTSGKSNDHQPMLCSLSSSSAASDVAYALQLPVPVVSLQVDTIGSSFDTMIYFRDTQCTTDAACDDDSGGSATSLMTLTNVLPGGYAIVVDGYSSYNGAYTLNVRGTVAAGTPCSSPLFSGGANAVLVCPGGTSCTGTPLKCQ
jgi:hypothetical protein